MLAAEVLVYFGHVFLDSDHELSLSRQVFLHNHLFNLVLANALIVGVLRHLHKLLQLMFGFTDIFILQEIVQHLLALLFDHIRVE